MPATANSGFAGNQSAAGRGGAGFRVQAASGFGGNGSAFQAADGTMAAAGPALGSIQANGLQSVVPRNEAPWSGVPAKGSVATVGAGSLPSVGSGFGFPGGSGIGAVGTPYQVGGSAGTGGGAPWTNPGSPVSAGPWEGSGGNWSGDNGDWT